MPHRKLTLHEREIIAQMYYKGEKVSKIALRLERHRTTISRELKRNRDIYGDYYAVRAHRWSYQRKSAVRCGHRKLYDTPELEAWLMDHIRYDCWSPDVLAGRLKHEFPCCRSMWICTETIYRWFRENQQYCHYLCYGRKGYGKHGSGKSGQIRNRISIEERPEIVDNLERFGDWESDTIVGKGHKGYIASHVERKSKYTVLALLPDKQAKTFNRKSLQAFRRHQKQQELPLYTITTDNGKEFAGHEVLAERLKVDIYFAHPYSSWERGRNENLNRMVRYWFPKGMDFRELLDYEVQIVENKLNNRPRKSLGYRTPREVLFNLKC